MPEIIEELAGFINNTKFTDLPEPVTHEMKRLFLDSVGCAINGLATDRGRTVVEFARKFNETGVSTIIGTNYKVSPNNAAFANGELMNALDYDALSYFGRHDPPIVIPAALSLGESLGISGEDLLLAISLGLEVSNRLKSALGGVSTPNNKGSGKGKMLWPTVHGYSVTTLAAAASAGKVLKLDKEKMSNALGIAGCICPPSIFRKWTDTAPVRMTKYGPSGWVAQTGVTAALLAEMGYIGDTDLFNGEFGFWTYTGKKEEQYNIEGVLEDLTTKWLCSQIQYKQYPCGL